MDDLLNEFTNSLQTGYIDKSILNDIEEIMVNEPLYIHDKRLDKKGGQRNTRKNRGV
jgi:hypothetical protein